jgi:elongation factor Ts
MMDCKRALVESGGDLAVAERRLKEMGLSAAAKRSGRATNEGRIFATVNGTAAILELSSETDFVARNDQFVALGKQLVAEVAAESPRAPTDRMQELITAAVGKIKENIAVRRFHSVAIGDGDTLAHYLHGEGNIGVLIKLHASDAALAGHARINEAAFDLALHVAAYAPPFLTPDSVSGDYLAEQEAIFRKQAEALDKPAKIVEGIVKGKLRKHLQEICLLEQGFVKDPKLSVKQLVAGLGTELGTEVRIADYVYYRVGEEAPAAS